MKTTKTLFVALVLTALPTLTFAMCNYGQHQEASISCAEGTTYDPETKACVSISS